MELGFLLPWMIILSVIGGFLGGCFALLLYGRSLTKGPKGDPGPPGPQGPAGPMGMPAPISVLDSTAHEINVNQGSVPPDNFLETIPCREVEAHRPHDWRILGEGARFCPGRRSRKARE